MVCQQHRLGALDVRVTGHRSVRMPVGERDKVPSKVEQGRKYAGDGLFGVHPHVERDLVVP